MGGTRKPPGKRRCACLVPRPRKSTTRGPSWQTGPVDCHQRMTEGGPPRGAVWHKSSFAAGGPSSQRLIGSRARHLSARRNVRLPNGLRRGVRRPTAAGSQLANRDQGGSPDRDPFTAVFARSSRHSLCAVLGAKLVLLRSRGSTCGGLPAFCWRFLDWATLPASSLRARPCLTLRAPRCPIGGPKTPGGGPLTAGSCGAGGRGPPLARTIPSTRSWSRPSRCSSRCLRWWLFPPAAVPSTRGNASGSVGKRRHVGRLERLVRFPRAGCLARSDPIHRVHLPSRPHECGHYKPGCRLARAGGSLGPESALRCDGLSASPG